MKGCKIEGIREVAEQSGWMMGRNPIHPICDGLEGNDQKRGANWRYFGKILANPGDFWTKFW